MPYIYAKDLWGTGKSEAPAEKEETPESVTGWVPVSSSIIKAVKYNGGVLSVDFYSTGKYTYKVSEDVFNALLAAPSKGSYFWRNIR